MLGWESKSPMEAEEKMSSSPILGEWKMVSSENFEDVLKEFGVGYLLRKMALTTKPNVKFEVNGDEWTFSTISAIKCSVIKFKLNEDFQEETMDGRKLTAKFVLENDKKLIQTQHDKDGNLVATITREITDDGKLRVVIKATKAEAIRVYEKI